MIDSDLDDDNLDLESIKRLVQKELDEEKILIHKHGSLSWEIFEISEKWRALEISDAYFRQQIRELVDKHINDRQV